MSPEYNMRLPPGSRNIPLSLHVITTAVDELSIELIYLRSAFHPYRALLHGKKDPLPVRH